MSYTTIASMLTITYGKLNKVLINYNTINKKKS